MPDSWLFEAAHVKLADRMAPFADMFTAPTWQRVLVLLIGAAQPGTPHRSRSPSADVLYQVPAIGDLDGARQRSCRRQGVAAAAIARDDSNLGLSRQPRLSRGNFPDRQKTDDLTAFKIADHGPVSLVLPPGPVVVWTIRSSTSSR